MTSTTDVQELQQKLSLLKKEIAKAVIGQDETVEQLLIALLAGGHALLEGVPGLGKTLLVRSVADALHLDYRRIQFTPDLMPSDIVGTSILQEDDAGKRHFKFIPGPLFSNIVLADEINRTPPKTQSALLEAMQEYSVTIAGQKYPLEKPFFVLATQNPIEQEGTYPLPEAQLDRFMFNVKLDYPKYQSEVEIVKNTTSSLSQQVSHVLNADEIKYFQTLVRKVPVSDNVVEYAVKLVHKTRPHTEMASTEANQYLEWGAGPRASQFLVLGAKCNALFTGKYSPDIEDVQAVAVPILRHRVVRNFKAEAENVTVDDLIKKLL